MYKIGDKVFHKDGGVFFIDNIETKNYGFGDITYLILTPCFINSANRSLTIFVPESQAKEILRPIMTSQEAEDVIYSLGIIEPIWFSDAKERKERFAEMVHSNDIHNTCIILKSLFTQQLKLSENNKSLNLSDYDYLKKLKKGIEEELALSLSISVEEVSHRIENSINHAI
jgi:RNA polymerase-interacting CarD/CdnL/TRCF family regulator